EGLERVGAAADAAIQQYRHFSGDGFEHVGQRFERGDGAIDLAATVVRDEDAVDAVVERARGVVTTDDAFENDRQLRLRAQPGNVVPGEARVREDAAPERDGRGAIFFRLAL